MRFILLFVLLVVGVGLYLQMGADLPYLNWVGQLPGDLILRREGVMIFLPLTTSFLISLVFSLLFR
jgi:hypothetical protein